jgi:hypothetical protein
MRLLDLEENGLIKLENNKIKMSYFLICCYLIASSTIPYARFWTDVLISKDFWWQDWEGFNKNYIAFRFSLYAYLEFTAIPLQTFFAGAKMNVPDELMIKIPQDVNIGEVEKRYPNANAYKIKQFDFSTSVLNAEGAAFDAFMNVETSLGKPLLLAFQMKFTKKNSYTITDALIKDEFDKASQIISGKLPGIDFIFVLLSNCESNFTESSLLPHNCVVITETEQKSFYGELISTRLNCIKSFN